MPQEEKNKKLGRGKPQKKRGLLRALTKEEGWLFVICQAGHPAMQSSRARDMRTPAPPQGSPRGQVTREV